MAVELDEGSDEVGDAPLGFDLVAAAETEKPMRRSRKGRGATLRGGVASPLQSLGQSLLQVGGGCWEGELHGDAAAVVEDGGQVVSFGGGQDGQLVVGLTCRRTQADGGRSLELLRPYQDSPTFQSPCGVFLSTKDPQLWLWPRFYGGQVGLPAKHPLRVQTRLRGRA